MKHQADHSRNNLVSSHRFKMHGHLKPVKLQDSSFKTIGAITEASSKRNSYLRGKPQKNTFLKVNK